MSLRTYMPRKHRRFLEDIDARTAVRTELRQEGRACTPLQ